MAKDLDSDATAAVGIARRRGLGKLRHLDVEDLWVPHKFQAKLVDLVKVDGKQNPAAMFTKYVGYPIHSNALLTMGLHAETGRAASAPQAAIS